MMVFNRILSGSLLYPHRVAGPDAGADAAANARADAGRGAMDANMTAQYIADEF
jgi:hypothetical protein